MTRQQRIFLRPLRCLPFFLFGTCIVIICIFTLTSKRLPVKDDPSVEIDINAFNDLANKDAFLRHADDMHRLRKSIINELSQLEQKRNKLKATVQTLEDSHKDLSTQLKDMEHELSQIKVDVKNMILTKKEIFSEYSSAPLPLPMLSDLSASTGTHMNLNCDLNSCFDYSRCSVISGFPIYLYPTYTDDNLLIAWKSAIENSNHITNKPESACMYFLLVKDDTKINTQSLEYWKGDGRNHIIINVGLSSLTSPKSRAMVAQTNRTKFDRGFDIFLPYVDVLPVDYKVLPLLLPLRKKILLSFYGQSPTILSEGEKEILGAINKLNSSDIISFITQCTAKSVCLPDQWCLCSDHHAVESERSSIFVMIPNCANMPSYQFTYRIYRALINGAIPVLLGDFYQLPFSDFISWEKAIVSFPLQRVTELEYILRNILESDIMSYKKHGRIIFNDYFSSVEKAAHALINTLRYRINMPPPPVPEAVSTLVYDEHHPMQTFQSRVDNGNEILGPIEAPFPSPSYQRNFTSFLQFSHWSHSSYIFPYTPWDPGLPTDAKYHGSPYGFRPINGGAGGSGTEFSASLGGNYPHEQFTIVILTYDRSELLQQQLAQFNGLPYLNKVVVIWNNPQYPPSTLKWPHIHVPIQVIKAERNSLNNRFMPYKEIETEAVLSMDDDMGLRHDEIIFAFRVWREFRDRIVGFPGRYHAWNIHDEKWNYNSNHSCELSMILTGAAFFHKYYMYQYSYSMPQAIRDKVDEYMNCEDLAMNFLVSHITGQPPVKTTSRWTFRCPTCGEASLWIDESHFNERHKCIQFFIEVYGYLPLKYTQFRADSVLFKTRVPEDKSKCFVFV